MSESYSRTLIKIFLWRILAIIVTITFAYIFTGSFNKSWKIALFDNFFKLFMHYLYERLFINIKWGVMTDINSNNDKENDNPENV